MHQHVFTKTDATIRKMLLIIIATISSVATLEYGMSMVLKTKENQGRKT